MRIFLLILIISVVAAVATGVAGYVLYEASFEQQRARLVEVAQSQARLLESMARLDMEQGAGDVPGGAFAATLGRLREAHKRFESFGETGEFTVARHEGDRIVFLLSHRHGGLEVPEPVLLSSDLAEPMRRALIGESGMVVGLDYRGAMVLAAYEPVDVLDLGIVAKIDLAEIQGPFVRAGRLSAGCVLVLVVFGVLAFVKIDGSLVRRLKASEGKYKALFANASDGVLVMTDVVEDCNAQACRLLGCECADIIGRTIVDFSPPTQADGRASAAVVKEKIEAALAGKPQFFHWRHLRKDGVQLDTSFSLKAVELPEKRVLLATFGDITEHVREEEALKRLSRQNELILNAAGEGIYGLDLEGRTTFVNPAASKMLGWDADELIGRFQHDLMHHTRPGGTPYPWKECPIYAAFLDGEVRHVADEVFWRKDSSSFPVEYMSTPIRENGKIVGAVVVFRDITERKRTEDQLRQAVKMEAVGQLTGGVAHDFNNLLAVIMGNLEILEGKLGGDKANLDLVRKAISAAERGATLTNRLLVFSRKQALKPVLTDLNRLVSSMTDLLKHSLGEPVAIETALAEGLWLTEVDPGGLENALLNLAINARDAMPNGGRLTIETANARLDEEYAAAQEEIPPGEYVMLRVSDTGTGMTQEVKKRAFEPFFTTKEVGQGSGLGLSMVYGFVKQSGGEVRVYSELGRGTSVKIYLPRVFGEEAEDRGEAEAALEVPGRSEKILVVEDDSEARRLATTMLSELGFSALEARDGGSALAVLEEAPDVAVLFTDVLLPGDMSGTDLAREAMLRRPGLKVLYTSGFAENVVVHHERLDEGVELLLKPYRKDDLGRKLHAILGP